VSDQPEIVLLRAPADRGELRRLVSLVFGDMVKYVVDVERGVIALGGELHADAEALLLADGSAQADLWGANYYPGQGEDSCIEYTSLINISPARGNRGMEVLDPAIRQRIRELTLAFVGRGEELT
jgi:hypothetical protein